MKNLYGLDWFIGAILVVGGINWGMVGLFDLNLVTAVFGEATTATRVVYALVGISALYVTGSALASLSNESNVQVIHRNA